MKFFITTITALAVSAIVSAQVNILSVTSPLNGTVFTAGEPALITWILPAVDTITQIVLAHGDVLNLQQDGPIATNVSAAALSYTWNIPSTTAQGVYALIFGTLPDVAYSPQFIIQAAGSASSAVSASPSSALVSSAAVSSVSASETIASSSIASSSSSGSSDLSPASSSTSQQTSALATPSLESSSAATIHHQPAVGMVALGLAAVAVVAVLA